MQILEQMKHITPDNEHRGLLATAEKLITRYLETSICYIVKLQISIALAVADPEGGGGP